MNYKEDKELVKNLAFNHELKPRMGMKTANKQVASMQSVLDIKNQIAGGNRQTNWREQSKGDMAGQSGMQCKGRIVEIRAKSPFF